MVEEGKEDQTGGPDKGSKEGGAARGEEANRGGETGRQKRLYPDSVLGLSHLSQVVEPLGIP